MAEISSPPYPSQTTTSSALFRHLETFRNWLIEEQQSLYSLVPGKFQDNLLSAPEDMATETIWDNVDICGKYWTLTHLRGIREGWDSVLREHEDGWNSKLALYKRYNLVRAARRILAAAFISPEVREMHMHKQRRDYDRQMTAFNKHLRKIAKAEASDEDDYGVEEEEDEKETSEFDDWFGRDNDGDE